MANVITAAQETKRQHPEQFFQSLAMSVLDETSGKLLEYRQLRKHLKLAHIWNISYANELSRLCHGVVKESKPPKKKHVEGTHTLRIIHFKDIPRDIRK